MKIHSRKCSLSVWVRAMNLIPWCRMFHSQWKWYTALQLPNWNMQHLSGQAGIMWILIQSRCFLSWCSLHRTQREHSQRISVITLNLRNRQAGFSLQGTTVTVNLRVWRQQTFPCMIRVMWSMSDGIIFRYRTEKKPGWNHIWILT